jgi:hypothetical protein
MAKNVSFSKIIFDKPMQRTLLNHVNKVNNIKVVNTRTFGKLPRWSFYNINAPMVNYTPVTLKSSKNYPGYYEIQNGRHRIAKLYLEGKRTVKAILT